MSKNSVNSVLFVCLGNICRSAMAEGVFRAELVRKQLRGLTVDSAGTSDWHVGEPPDERAIAAAARRDIDISGLTARQIRESDFEQFDLIAAMDGANLAKLRGFSHGAFQHKARLYLDFARDLPVREVADPYYGGDEDFDQVLDLLDIGARALSDHIARSRS